MKNELHELLNKAPFLGYLDLMELVYYMNVEMHNHFANLHPESIDEGIVRIAVEGITRFDYKSYTDRLKEEKEIIIKETKIALDFLISLHVSLGRLPDNTDYALWVAEQTAKIEKEMGSYLNRIVYYTTGCELNELTEFLIHLHNLSYRENCSTNFSSQIKSYEIFQNSEMTKLILGFRNQGIWEDEIEKYLSFYAFKTIQDVSYKVDVLLHIFYSVADATPMVFAMLYLYHQAHSLNPKEATTMLHKFNLSQDELSSGGTPMTDADVDALLGK